MPSDPNIQERIAKIISQSEDVQMSDIKWVMDGLGAFERRYKLGYLFRIGHHRLVINEHYNGKPGVPAYSIQEFRNLMVELGLY